MTVHQDLSQASNAALMAEITLLKAKLAARRNAKLTLRVSKQGAVSVYGMGKWPVTLYSQQWTRLLECADEIKAFIVDNADALSVKE